MAEPCLGATLASIEFRVEQVFTLQRRLEQSVSELISSQSTTQQAVDSLSRNISKRPELFAASMPEADAQYSSDFCSVDAMSSCVAVGPMGSRDLLPRIDSYLPQMKSARADSGLKLQRFGSFESEAAVFSKAVSFTGERGSAQQWSSSVGMAGQHLSMSPAIVGVTHLGDNECERTLNHLMSFDGKQSTLDMTVGKSIATDVKSGRFFMLDPHGPVRVTHDMFSIIVLAVDVVSAPVTLAWDFDTGFFRMFNLCSLSFWAFDIVMSFITSVYLQGELETRPIRVAKMYLRSWCILDLIIVLADVLTLSMASSGDSAAASGSEILRLSKAGRFLRLARLFRIARVSEAFVRLNEASVFFEIIVETVKPLLIILLVNHILACAWWSIGTYLPSDTGLWWTNEPVSSSMRVSYADVTFSYQYLTCIHWSLTQLTPGSMQVVPLNSYERAFNCFALLLGMLLFSSLISSISAKMMQHYLKQKDTLSKLTALRRFLVDKVPPEVAFASQFHASRAMSKKVKPVVMKDIDAISLLPQALQRTILVELCSKHFQHPLMRWWFVMDSKGVQALCQNALEFIGLAAEDNLFFARNISIGAYIMTQGAGMYRIEDDAEDDRPEIEVPQGRFFCEASLWCKWKHVGELVATTGCELLSISAQGLGKCIDEVMDHVIQHVMVQYGRMYCTRLTAPLLLESEQPNDILVPFTDFDSILISLPLQCRQLIGAAAVKTTDPKNAKKTFDYNARVRAARDIRRGKECIMVNWEGEVERIVSLIALRVSRQDGKVLAQLGKWSESEGRAEADCDLPSVRQEGGESLDQGFARLLQGECAPFARELNRTGAQRETWRVLRRNDLPLKYMRTINRAELMCPLECLGLEFVQLKASRPSRHRPSLISFSHPGAMFATASEPPRMSRGPDHELDVHALANKAGEITLAGWLSCDDFRFFTTSAGEACLQERLDNVTLEPSVVEAAKTRFAASQELSADASRNNSSEDPAPSRNVSSEGQEPEISLSRSLVRV